jgi:hypothetical protein
MAGKVNDTFSEYHPCQLVKNDRQFRKYLYPHHQHLILRIGTESVPEKLAVNQLTRLLVREIFITLLRLTEK